MQNTYLFYDIETTGLNKSFDQVLQFAAIRTDLELNELERYNFLVKLNPDVIPSPYALITHHISLSAVESGECEYEAICKIHQLLNKPRTISLGYNTLGFDDEFLRFGFYRNLLTPYTHQYANGCSRMDLYPMAAMYFLFKPDVIAWPERDGKSTLKLEYLSVANELATGAAHDAMVDVEATVALAKHFYKERKMWDYLCGYFDKNSDLARMAQLQDGLMVDGIFGADNFYQSPVLSLGQHNHYKNQTLWLRLDRDDLQKTTRDSVAETTFVVHKKPGENYLLLPNEERFMRYLTPERLELVRSNKAWLEANPEILQAIISYHKDYKYPLIPNVDVDAGLYQFGFLSYEDQRQCQDFGLATVSEKAKLIDRFTNSRLRAQAVRVIGRNYPESLPAKYLNEFQEYMEQINSDPDYALVDYRNKRRYTPTEAQQEIAELLEKDDISEQQRQLLLELQQYLDS